jgi:hypothetical protein
VQAPELVHNGTSIVSGDDGYLFDHYKAGSDMHSHVVAFAFGKAAGVLLKLVCEASARFPRHSRAFKAPTRSGTAKEEDR